MITKTANYVRQNGQFDMSLQVTIPNEWEPLAPVNVGYTAGIETDRVSPTWLFKANEMSKVVVVSNHSKDVFQSTIAEGNDPNTNTKIKYELTTPIESVGYAVQNIATEPIENFNPTTNFNFLCVSQWGPRKNFENTIKWWVEEFYDQDVGLVLKTSIANNSTIDKTKTNDLLMSILSKYENRKCKVYLLHGDLSAGQMKWIYSHKKIKCLINIAHGEGFGLPLFEAAQNALPVATIGWSGQMDYLVHENVEYFNKIDHKLKTIGKDAVWDQVLQADSRWAFAEQGSFKMQMRKIRKNWKESKKNAKQLQSIINKKYTEEIMYKKFCDAIEVNTLESVTL
jgi:fructosamine-3-kinase